jgi:hypothetical protein
MTDHQLLGVTRQILSILMMQSVSWALEAVFPWFAVLSESWRGIRSSVETLPNGQPSPWTQGVYSSLSDDKT